MNKSLTKLIGAAALALMLLTTAACSSGDSSVADYEKLTERVDTLERQLAEQKKEIEELKSASADMQPTSGETSASGTNGPADKGDDIFITHKQYQQLEIGMTYDEVVSILGGDGNAISEAGNMIVYSYLGAGATGANAVLSFQDGKLLSKAQAGLE